MGYIHYDRKCKINGWPESRHKIVSLDLGIYLEREGVVIRKLQGGFVLRKLQRDVGIREYK